MTNCLCQRFSPAKECTPGMDLHAGCSGGNAPGTRAETRPEEGTCMRPAKRVICRVQSAECRVQSVHVEHSRVHVKFAVVWS